MTSSYTRSYEYPRLGPVEPQWNEHFDARVEHRDGTPVVPEDVEAEEQFIEMVNQWPGTPQAQQSDVVEEFLEGIPQADPEVWIEGVEPHFLWDDVPS